MRQSQEITKDEQESLHNLMNREIRIMRELLSSMQQEQQSLLVCDAGRLQYVLKEREALTETMQEVRDARLDLLRSVATKLGQIDDEHPDLTEEACHVVLEEFAREESCEILILRDQMLALLSAMTDQNSRNSHLLQAKVQTTRQLIQRLHPDDPNRTYDGRGAVAKQSKPVKVAVINQEV